VKKYDILTIYIVGDKNVVGIEKDNIIIFNKDPSLKNYKRNYKLTLYTVVPLFFTLTIGFSFSYIKRIKYFK
jgi:hypothetical protein